MLQEVVDDLKTIVNPYEVVQACRVAEMSRQGYMAIYNVLVEPLRVHDLKSPLLLPPYHVKKERKRSNFIVQDLLGGFIHILDAMVSCMDPSLKNTCQLKRINKKSTNVFHYIEYNKIF